MNYKILFIFFTVILSSCAPFKQQDVDSSVYKDAFISKGFTLVYSEKLKKNNIISDKLDDRGLFIFQKNLKNNTSVKITNLLNDKYIIGKVSKNANYPNFYNSVISSRIKNELEIDENEPYVEIKEIHNNSSFVAKKAKTYDEEKNVATKAPVDEIKIKSLSGTDIKKKKTTNKIFSYIIKIGDFILKNLPSR